jgi:hypothetical protein
MSDIEQQQELYTRMVAVHRDLREIVRDYEPWASTSEVDDLTAAALEIGRIALKFGGEIIE